MRLMTLTIELRSVREAKIAKIELCPIDRLGKTIVFDFVRDDDDFDLFNRDVSSVLDRLKELDLRVVDYSTSHTKLIF